MVSHMDRTSEGAVRRDLCAVLAAVVGALDALLVVAAIGLGGDGLLAVARALPFLLAGNFAIALVLGAAGTSLALTWVHT